MGRNLLSLVFRKAAGLQDLSVVCSALITKVVFSGFLTNTLTYLPYLRVRQKPERRKKVETSRAPLMSSSPQV